MSRYRVMSAFNLFLGVLLLLFSYVQIFNVIPRMGRMYRDFAIDSNANQMLAYATAAIVAFLAIGHLFLGIKGFSDPGKKEKYFNYGIWMIVVTFLAGGLLTAASVLIAIDPIYELTSP